MFPDLKKIAISLLVMTAVFLLRAQESSCFFQIRTDLTAQLPAPEARQKALPRLFVEIGQNLKKNGITLDLPLIAFSGKNLLTEKKVEQGLFLLYFHNLKIGQLRYLLKYNLLHPNWKYREQNGVFFVEAPDLKFVLFQHKNTNGFFASPAYDLMAQTGAEQILKQIDLNSKSAISGTFFFSPDTVLHPAMQNVRKADFSISGGKNKKAEPLLLATIELTGQTSGQTKKIADDINRFLAAVYINAEKEAAKTNRRLTDEERKAISCLFKYDKAVLSVSFNAEWTTTFLHLFSENLR